MERNKFSEKKKDELLALYEQYCKWNKTGVIADESKELREMADVYVEMYDVHGLHIMELDLLKVIAQHWFNRY